jgi:outer membrane protein assembly factor BamB
MNYTVFQSMKMKFEVSTAYLGHFNHLVRFDYKTGIVKWAKELHIKDLTTKITMSLAEITENDTIYVI